MRREALATEYALSAGGRRERRRLARAILADALDRPPPRKLVDDYARFLVAAGADITVTGRDVQAWLDTWRPPLSALFGSDRGAS